MIDPSEGKNIERQSWVISIVSLKGFMLLTVGFSLLRHPADPIIRKSLVAAFAFR